MGKMRAIKSSEIQRLKALILEMQILLNECRFYVPTDLENRLDAMLDDDITSPATGEEH